ncbi:MAG: ribbon-helix-helix protein, CopG family, partial [Candidatus Dormibacteraeota bacterium]|nr:ribbon-helix-helix protein, CopG family [Candidatus Dormibacteraeota bacterium]
MKRRTNIYLEADQAAALDDAAAARGISRAELIRQLIDRGIGVDAAADLEADLAAIDAAFGVLSGDDDIEPIPRGADDRSRYLERLASRP